MRNDRRLFSARRTIVALVFGVVAGAIGAFAGASWWPSLAWNVFAATLLARVLRLSWPLGPADTKQLAEDEGSAISMDGFLVIAAVAGLVAVGLVVALGSTGPVEVLLAVLAVILSWALVNTVFAFRYARLYYVDEDGGIDFNQDEPPSYSDFAYMAFTVGASFAVSDNNTRNTRIRKTVLVHALLSYGFSTVIIATAINLVANLGS